MAVALAEKEYEKYRIVQDRVVESDFDRAVKKITHLSPGKKGMGK